MTLVGHKSPRVVQKLKIEVKTHLRNDADKSLIIQTSLLFGQIKDRRDIYLLQNISFIRKTYSDVEYDSDMILVSSILMTAPTY